MTYTKKISRELNGLDLDYKYLDTTFKTYWCRVSISEFKDFNDKPHAHSFFEIHLCLKGYAKFFVEGKEYLLKAGQFAFVPKKCIHKIKEISKDFDKLVWGVSVDYDLSNENASSTLLIKKHHQYLRNFCILQYNQSMSTLLDLVFTNIDEKKGDWDNYVRQYLYCLWTEITRLLFLTSKIKYEKSMIVPIRFGIEIDTIKRFILDNIKSKVKVGDIAMQLAMSERQLYRIFESSFGMTAKQYIFQIVMEEAKRYLIETSCSIDKIAENIGFSDRFTFERAFVRYEGMSPAMFRNSLKK